MPMKTKEQIIRYTSQCSFTDEDWEKVVYHCRKKFGGGNVRRALKPLSKSTYTQFLSWLKTGFGVGDIVRYGHTLGIVGAYTPDYASLSVYFTTSGEFVEKCLIVKPNKLFKAASQEVAEVDDILTSKNLKFSIRLSRLVCRYKPCDGDIVRVSFNEIKTTGIFRSEQAGEISFYAYVESGKILKNHVLNANSVVMSLPTKTDVERLQIALAKNGMEWSAWRKVLSVLKAKRADKGGRYWYLSENFTIISDKDMYTKKHNQRYDSGNYFCSYGDSILFAQKVKELRKELAGAT